MIVYNKYTSEATDSGFIAYNGINVYASQAMRLSKLQLQGGYAYTEHAQISYSTAELTADYSLKKWLEVGAGIKYNKVIRGDVYMGESIQLRTDFTRWGGLMLQYEKSFLPTLTQQLEPTEIGRLHYYRRF